MIVFRLWFLLLLITCCIGHKQYSNNNVIKSKSLYFSHTTALPINYNISYYIELYNSTNHPITLSEQDFTITGLVLKPNLFVHDVLNVSRCKYLLANSSCSIEINIYNKLSDNEGSFSLSVRSGSIGATTMIKYFASHDDWNFDTKLDNEKIDVNIKDLQPMLISIPIVFNKDYHDVNISHNSFISAQWLDCNNKHITRSQHVCVLQVRMNGGKNFESLLRVTAIQDGLDKTEDILSTNIVNTMTNFGNLLEGLSSNYLVANGSSTTTLVLANNGLGVISNIAISFVNTNSVLKIISKNSCSTSIASNGSCSIVISANNSNIWVVDGIKTQYSDGMNNNLSAVAPIVIKPSGSSGALDLTVSGSFTNTTIYNTAATTVTLSNSGALAVYNITATASLPSGVTLFQNTCSSVLAAGSSCQYVYQYTPTSITSSNSFDFIINGQYSFASSPVTISNKTSLAYSSVNFISCLYTQSGSAISAYRMNPDYSFTAAGNSITFSGNYASVVFGGRLLVFNSTGSIATYPINVDGSLSSLVTVTPSSSFNALPSAAVVNSYNGYLYVSTFYSATSMITTYKCSNITAGNTISCSSYSVGPYTYTNRISGVAYEYSSNLIYATAGMAQMLYTANDGQGLSATGPSTGGFAAVTSDNLTSDMTLVYGAYGTLYSVGYNSNGTVNTNPTNLSISISGSVTQLFLQGIGHSSYTFSKPLLYILSSNGSIKIATLDNTYSSTAISSNVVNFAINAQ